LTGYSIADALVEAEIELVESYAGGDAQLAGFIRDSGVNNRYVMFARYNTGTSARIRRVLAGAIQEVFLPDTSTYYALNQWLTAKMTANVGQKDFQMLPGIDTITAAETPELLPGAGGIAFGVRQGRAFLRSMTVRRLTAGASSGYLLFQTSADAITWSGTYNETQLNAGSVPNSRYLRVRVNFSRADAYASYAILYNVALNYIMA
jgi:hypothetical protein